MRCKKLILTGVLCTMGFGFATIALYAAPHQGYCDQIRSACLGAGYVPGAGTRGYGLKRDCIRPIMRRGVREPHYRLPPIDPRLVEGCRASDPNYGQGRAARGARNQPQYAQPTDPGAYGSDRGTYGPRDENAGSFPQDRTYGAPPPPRFPAQSAPSAGSASTDRPAETTRAAHEATTTVAQATESKTPAGDVKRPNIIFVLTDDLSTNLVQYMPHVLQMQKDGVTFTNYFVTDSLCCPSRASIFTGRYPHNTGIYRNKGADGGYQAFHDRGQDKATFATALSAAGYRTAMFGKYLNRYRPETNPPGPSWTVWKVAGNAYREFNYTLNEDRTIIQYGNNPTDYLTDVLSDAAVRFIKESNGPFMIEIATFAPHRPYTPAPRDANAFPGLQAPRGPSFNAAPDASAVKWLQPFPALSAQDVSVIDREYRMRAQSVQAVDKMIGELQAAVVTAGLQNNTYFVFSSDNGYHMGDHRMMPGKMTAFDMDIRVPLVVTGPNIAGGAKIDNISQNIDLCPTFAELGGTTATNADGRSLAPLLFGQKAADWRTVALVEHHGPVLRDRQDPDAFDSDVANLRGGRAGRKPGKYGFRNGNPNSYEAIRSATWIYVEYVDGEKEYHDLTTDPGELRNTYTTLPDAQKASLHATLQAVVNCRDAKSCQTAERVFGPMTLQ